MKNSFDDEIFSTSHDRRKLTRSEKRKNHLNYHPSKDTSTEPSPHILDMTPEQFKEKQQQDPSLTAVWEAAKGLYQVLGLDFFERNGLVYKRWMLPGGPGANGAREVEQLIIPAMCCQEVLMIAHTIPLGGHLGKEKTVRGVLQVLLAHTPPLSKLRSLSKFKLTRCETCPTGASTYHHYTIQENCNGYYRTIAQKSIWEVIMQQDTQKPFP